MGKRLVIILISIILYQPIYGQSEKKPLDKGQNYIGFFGTIPYQHNSMSHYSSIRYGRLIFNRFATGVNVNSYSYSHSSSQTLEFVPFARYYILNKKISPVVEFHYNYSITFPNDAYEGYNPYNSKVNLGAGITFNRVLWKRFGAEIVVFYGRSKYLQTSSELWGIDGLLYLTYHFPK